MNATFKPIYDHVIISPETGERKTAAGLLISAQPTKNIGRVVAVGPGVPLKTEGEGEQKFEPMHVKVGDIVVYPELKLQTFLLEGKTFVVLREGDVFSILENYV